MTRSITLNLNQTTQLVLPSTDNEISSPKLSEPRHLFSLQRELGPQQAPRWPAECQVNCNAVMVFSRTESTYTAHQCTQSHNHGRLTIGFVLGDGPSVFKFFFLISM